MDHRQSPGVTVYVAAPTGVTAGAGAGGGTAVGRGAAARVGGGCGPSRSTADARGAFTGAVGATARVVVVVGGAGGVLVVVVVERDVDVGPGEVVDVARSPASSQVRVR